MSDNHNPAPFTHLVGDEERLKRVGRHLIEKAFAWGWKDDGEGAFEFVQRLSYAQGKEDANTLTCHHCLGKGYQAGDPEGAPIEDCDYCAGSGQTPPPQTKERGGYNADD